MCIRAHTVSCPRVGFQLEDVRAFRENDNGQFIYYYLWYSIF